MRTIAITIEEATLDRIDQLIKRGGLHSRNRSEVIRQAVREYIARLERPVEEEQERDIFRRHRRRLERQAAALVKEQAGL